MAEEEVQWSVEPEESVGIQEEIQEKEEREHPRDWEFTQLLVYVESISESLDVIARHLISAPRSVVEKVIEKETEVAQKPVESTEPDELPGFGERITIDCVVTTFPEVTLTPSNKRVCDLQLQLQSGRVVKMPLWGGVSGYMIKRIKQGDHVRFEDVEVMQGWPNRESKSLKWVTMTSKVTKLEVPV